MTEDKVVKLELRHKSKRPGSDPVACTPMGDVGPHDAMTPLEALDVVCRQEPTNLLIVHTYIDKDGDEAFAVISSQMSNAEAVYLIERAKMGMLDPK